MSLLLSVAQLHSVAGDLQRNARAIDAAAAHAHASGARLLLTPASALAGPRLQDLARRPAFIAARDQTLEALAQASAAWPGLTLLVGGTLDDEQNASLTYAVLREGRLLQRVVLDATQPFALLEVDGVCVALLAPDAAPAQAAQAAQAGAQLLLTSDVQAFYLGAPAQRQARLQALAAAARVPLVSAQPVGGQDEWVFDGGSLAVGADGVVVLRAPCFDADQAQLAWQPGAPPTLAGGALAPEPGDEETLWRALVRALRDYVDGNGFPGVLIGLSGGMDSALVLALAVDALGARRVRTVMMPSPYTAQISGIDARDMAERLGVRYDSLAIAPLFEGFKAMLSPLFEGRAEDTTEENLQARIRGSLLMALSNKFGSVVVTTGNKSELATGYCTLYGDMAGGFALIKDLTKTRVYALARWRNAHSPLGGVDNPIPERIITRAPSAELRPDQTDQDSLPPYEVLDAIIERYVEQDAALEDVVRAGFAREVVERVVRLIHLSEYKRRQAPLGVALTRRAFGTHWRYPVGARFRA